jgi:hypothetical protein
MNGKTVEGVRLQLEHSPDRAIVVSTLVEAWAVVKAGLVKEGLIDDVQRLLLLVLHLSDTRCRSCTVSH